MLAIPAGVWRVHQNAGTFRPYDADRFLGDTSPSPLYPAPTGSGDKCGAFGKILLIAVAVAVTAILPQVAPAVFGSGVIGGAATGVAASLVSQGVGLATGIQDEFSFKQVALAGISGGIAGGAGASGAFGKMTEAGFKAGSLGIRSAVASAAARGVATSLVTQGIAVATGLQGKFDWAGVAAAGIGGGVSRAFQPGGGISKGIELNGVGGVIASNMAGGIAGAASVSLATGNSFGDTLIRSLPSIIGNTVGSLVASGISGRAGAGNPRSDEAQNAVAADTAAAQEPTAGVGGGQVGYRIDVTSSLTGLDTFSPTDFDLRLPASVYLTMAGGNVQKARDMVLRSFGPLEADIASSTPSTGGIIPNVELIGDGGTRMVNANVEVRPYWRTGMGSFGQEQFTDASLQQASWVEDKYITQRGLAAAAQFDREAAEIGLMGTKIGTSMAGYVPGALVSTYDYSRGSISGYEYSASLIPGHKALEAATDLAQGARAAERAFLSVDDFAKLPRTGTIDAKLIRFSQDSAGANFKPPFGSVDDFASGLANKSIDPATIKPIRIVDKDGMIFTLDNRRLHAFQKAGVEIPYQKLDAIPKRELRKFTTQNNGTSIIIR